MGQTIVKSSKIFMDGMSGVHFSVRLSGVIWVIVLSLAATLAAAREAARSALLIGNQDYKSAAGSQQIVHTIHSSQLQDTGVTSVTSTSLCGC